MAKMKGFEDLVKMVMKDRPDKPTSTEDIWNKFLRIVFIGGKRSEPEVNLIISMLRSKNLLDLEYVKKTDGDDWRDAVSPVINERLPRIQDDETKEMFRGLVKEIFRVSASIKGGARFFKKEELTPEKLSSLLSTKEKTWEFIDSLAKNEDVSNIKYTKIIIWLQSLGYAFDFCAPTYQLKKFVNDHIEYYQFYEDDVHFMKEGEKFAEGVKKRVKGATPRDVAAAIFIYITLKNMLPPRSGIKKNFMPGTIVSFLKKKKMTISGMNAMLSDSEERYKLMEALNDFVEK